MKKIVVLLLFAVFLVLPVSAAEQKNYFNTSHLTDGRFSGAQSKIIGQSLILTCDNYGQGYVFYSYTGSSLVSLRGCQTHFSFSALASADNGPQIAIRFYQGDAILQTIYCAPEVVYDITFPENTDSVRLYFYGNYGGTAVKGDTVTYSDIRLMADRSAISNAGFLASVGSVFGFLGSVSSGMMDVVFSYKFMAAAILMPFLVWLVWRVMQWFQVPAVADIRVPDLRGKFGLKRLGAKRMKGRTVKIDGRYYMIPMGKTRGKHRAKSKMIK